MIDFERSSEAMSARSVCGRDIDLERSGYAAICAAIKKEIPTGASHRMAMTIFMTTSLKISTMAIIGAARGPMFDSIVPKKRENVMTPRTFICTAASTMFGGNILSRTPMTVSRRSAEPDAAVGDAPSSAAIPPSPPDPGWIIWTMKRPRMTAIIVVEAKYAMVRRASTAVAAPHS